MARFSYLEVFAMIVILFLVVCFVKFVFKAVFTYAIGPMLCCVNFKSQGRWALITGCTDGVGKEYARQLAAKGCDIVLISRSLEKLRATAEEIESEYNVLTKIIQVDFSEDGSIYENIEKEISDLEIGTLVNNVGVCYPYPEYFLDIPDWDKLLKGLVGANIVAMTKITHMVLLSMLKRNKGVIINIGSISAIVPSPLLTAYAATKAYVSKFTEGLQQEYGNKGVIIQCVTPSYVCTNMSGIRNSSLFAPTSKDYVKSALSLVGTTSMTSGYLPHSILGGVVSIICSVSNSFGVWLVTRAMLKTRRNHLKKYKNY